MELIQSFETFTIQLFQKQIILRSLTFFALTGVDFFAAAFAIVYFI